MEDGSVRQIPIATVYTKACKGRKKLNRVVAALITKVVPAGYLTYVDVGCSPSYTVDSLKECPPAVLPCRPQVGV